MSSRLSARPAVVPLENWTPVHPAALALARGELTLPTAAGTPSVRSPELATALANSNRSWNHEIQIELDRWLAGATVVVSGQQPGVFGGPLLTLVKAAAVVAEVRRRRRSGEDAVGFLWLATTDDDLPEMTWGRVALGGEIAEIRLPGNRGEHMGGALALDTRCSNFLTDLEERCAGEFCSAATALAARWYAPGTTLADATAGFLATLLEGTGVILVDARLPELARVGAEATAAVLEQLQAAWDLLAAGAGMFQRRGWSPPLRLDRERLPVFRAEGIYRRRLASADGSCPTSVRVDQVHHPEDFLPNVWLRPLLQDAALGTEVSVLGGAELAYHIQAAELWPLAGVRRPTWRLRPHISVLTGGERQLIRQLALEPEDLLRRQPPRRLLGAGATRRRIERLRSQVETGLSSLAETARLELPALQGDLDATARKVGAAMTWLEERSERAAIARHDTTVARWQRLLAFVRPLGKAQERHLSVLAPVLRLGLQWPGKLAEALDPEHPGMHLMFWEEGGSW